MPASYSTHFERAFIALIGDEGGYVNDPRDPGGETKFGISKRAYPSENIKSLTLERAKQIYHRDYWQSCMCDEFSYAAGYLLFDAAVNMGVGTAIQLMQEALDVVADGRIGPITRRAIAQNANSTEFVVRFQAERGLYYASLHHFNVYGRGWLRRVIRGAIEATAEQ